MPGVTKFVLVRSYHVKLSPNVSGYVAGFRRAEWSVTNDAEP
jgi:hypothetical protein